MNLSFKDRIAFLYMIATAIIIALVFGAIYLLVKQTVLRNLDNILSLEAEKHSGEIQIAGDSILFINKAEWEEREHTEIQINPVFIQLIDANGQIMDKSPNLKTNSLPFNTSRFGGHFDTKLNEQTIRQAQLPLERNGKIKGYIITAISSESSFSVISKLRNVLFISYFIILIGLYFVSRYLAGRSIIPIQEVTNTMSRISKNNLNERVTLPQNRDEIYTLSSSFNALLERIEKVIKKEKQFTSDASHELRTPLATLRGTLEVLIRKPRTQQEYEDKIQRSLIEIERMATTLDQLLLLARLETTPEDKKEPITLLPTLIDEAISQYKKQITAKNLKISVNLIESEQALVPQYYSSIIISNILSNAIKYSHNGGTIHISVLMQHGRIKCTIEDEGIGIREEALAHIYDSFYRSDALEHKEISGDGLGLSIAKKCADAIRAELTVASSYSQGTVVTIVF